MFEQVVVGFVNEAAFQRFQVYFGGLFGVVTHRLRDDGKGNVLMVGGCGPGVAADVGGEVDSANELAQKGELGVVPSDDTVVLPIHQPGIVGLGEQGEEIEGRGGGATDDLLHHGFHLYKDALVGLAAHIGDDALREVGLAQMGCIDKGHAPGTEAEEEEVAGKFKLLLLLGESPTTFLGTIGQQGSVDVEGLQTADVGMVDGALDGVCHSAIGALEGMEVFGESLAHGLVIDGLEGAEIAGGGVLAESSGLQPRFVVGHEQPRESPERNVFFASAVQETVKTSGGTGIVLGNAMVAVLALVLCFALHEGKEVLMLGFDFLFHVDSAFFR